MLHGIVQNVDVGDYYLAGGTALSLQMGLRDSLDLDFFLPGEFNASALEKQIEDIFPGSEVVAHEINHSTCSVEIDGIWVSFLGYPYGMLRPFVTTDEMQGLNMASVLDIAEMKLAAIGGRGAKKDFFDLYHILNDTDITIKELVDGLFQKFGDRDFSYMAMGMDYFDDADGEELPLSRVPYDWDEMKEYFCEAQEKLIDALREEERGT